MDATSGSQKSSIPEANLYTWLKQVQDLDATGIYLQPITRTAFVSEEQADEYFRTIKQPMCFSTVAQNIKNGDYSRNQDGVRAFIHDLQLPFKNATEFYSSHGDGFQLLPGLKIMSPKMKMIIDRFKSKYHDILTKTSKPKQQTSLR